MKNRKNLFHYVHMWMWMWMWMLCVVVCGCVWLCDSRISNPCKLCSVTMRGENKDKEGGEEGEEEAGGEEEGGEGE